MNADGEFQPDVPGHTGYPITASLNMFLFLYPMHTPSFIYSFFFFKHTDKVPLQRRVSSFTDFS